MEHIAAFSLARYADEQRMSAGRLDAPAEAVRPSRRRRTAEGLRRLGLALRARSSAGRLAPARSAHQPAGSASGTQYRPQAAARASSTARAQSAGSASGRGAAARSARTGGATRSAQSGPVAGCAPCATA